MNNQSLHHATARKIYDDLWRDCAAALAQGKAQIDPHLRDRSRDRRRGWTLIVRPDAPTRRRLCDIIAQMRAIEPEQHFYHPDELHVTALSLISATDAFDEHVGALPRYRAALAAAFAGMTGFGVEFCGITGSPGAIMAQGFPEQDALNRLRDHLRASLGAAGLGAALDTRYRIVTAHATLMRFQSPLRNPAALLNLLEQARRIPFGRSVCAAVQWVENDWYMSRDAVQLIEEYHLENPLLGRRDFKNLEDF